MKSMMLNKTKRTTKTTCNNNGPAAAAVAVGAIGIFCSASCTSIAAVNAPVSTAGSG